MDAQDDQNSTKTIAAPMMEAVMVELMNLSNPMNTNITHPYTVSLAIVSLANSDLVNSPFLRLTAIPQTASINVAATTRNTTNECPAM